MTEEGETDSLLKDLPDQFMAFVDHKEAVQNLPADCTHLLASSPCPFQVIRYKSNVYATQFHPEADSQVFEAHINIYKNDGYFPPSHAERTNKFCHQQDVRVPGQILKNFVQAYKRS